RRKLPNAAIVTLDGRNVLPYESSAACVACVHSWLQSTSC
ncbi:alpha/beta hydrolase, partial [Pseudomonas sp. HMWF031]